MKKTVLTLMLAVVLLIGCEDSTTKSSSAEITISGVVTGRYASLIDYVGLFQTGGSVENVVDLDKDNASPTKIADVTGLSWSIKLPASPENFDLFQMVGWNDEDGDKKYDPESDEADGWGRVAGDSMGVAALWYFDKADTNHVAGWNVSSGFSPYWDINDHLNDWFIR